MLYFYTEQDNEHQGDVIPPDLINDIILKSGQMLIR